MRTRSFVAVSSHPLLFPPTFCYYNAMATLTATTEPKVYYPESDGKPMAENTVQYRWITTIQGNLDILFHDRPDVFVAGDNFWYPVEGEPGICLAPDVYVAFGRPKGDRGSYKQWEEGGVPPAVVFEVLSPSNTFREMQDKFEFYQTHGVREYYLIDPQHADRVTLEVFERERAGLRPRDATPEWVSPLTGVRFATTPTDLRVFYPDGRPFLSFVELGELQTRTEQTLNAERQRADDAQRQVEAERQRADDAQRQIEAERQRADDAQRQVEAERQRADDAQRQVEAERQRADIERKRAAKLAARLRELGVDSDAE
jgi:Uma2 family endonuclease